MTFGEKLKKLRTENELTQEELAEKIFVTRTAISKWETDRGYPSIESLKQLSNLFSISIDELISDADVENKHLLDKAQSRKYYWCAVVCLVVATVSTVIYYFTQLPHINILSIVGVIAYIVFGLLSKPKYKRVESRKNLIIPFIISRLVLAAIIIAVIAHAFIQT